MEEQLARAERGVASLRASRNDRWYPSFHIAAEAGWINDPNGLVHFEGRYHAFFQHYPFNATWGPMHWGHVSSEDMVTWRREPIALAPSIDADRDGVFSGSAVVSDDGKLVVVFTGHRTEGGLDRQAQVQCVAVSEDGITFDKKQVVIDCPEGVDHFRDPKVWRLGDTWYLVVGVAAPTGRGQIWLYTSPDLLAWDFDRVLFEDPDPDAFMLECPDLVPLGDRWVLIYSPMGPRPVDYRNRNGHNSGYVVGTWHPGEDFTPLTDYRPMDWGHQFYAPQSFETADGRRVVYGWMGSFTMPIATQEADGWCGQLTVPREITLTSDDRLVSVPIRELERLRRDTIDFGSFELGANEGRVLLDDADTAEIEVEIDLTATTADRVGFDIHKTPDGRSTLVAYDDLAGRVVIDRRNSGHGDRGYRGAPFSGERLSLRILVDRGSIEVFIAGGRESLSSFSFASEGPRAIELSSESGVTSVTSLRVHRLGTIWEPADR